MLTIKTEIAEVDIVTGFDCDRCGTHVPTTEPKAFYGATPIRIEAEKGSPWGEKTVELTFCAACSYEIFSPFVLMKEAQVH